MLFIFQMSKVFFDRHSIIRAVIKYKSSRKERIEAPRIRPSQPPILAEKSTKSLFVIARWTTDHQLRYRT